MKGSLQSTMKPGKMADGRIHLDSTERSQFARACKSTTELSFVRPVGLMGPPMRRLAASGRLTGRSRLAIDRDARDHESRDNVVTFVVTKHEGTGGRVNIQSVKEQLLYEMGDPHSYITPDVVADFASINLEPAGPNRVRVHGITGHPKTDFYKVSIAYTGGYKAVGTLVYS